MSKLNPTVKRTSEKKASSVRLAGGAGAVAAAQSNINTLRRAVLANLLWEDLAYVSGRSTADIISELIPKCDPAEVANLAIEARLQQKLRHTPLFIASEMCKYPETRALVSTVLPVIITRADMLTDFLAIYWKDGKKPLANQAKKGLAEAFHNFDEYQFAKYDRDGKIKLRDVMFLVHPEPNDQAEAALYKKIAERNLKTPDTWEVALSSGADKCQTWTRLITERKLGGLAMLRNIRNMENAAVDRSVIVEGLEKLNGRMLLPLDFLKAAKINPNYKSAIETAMVNSYATLPKLKGKTLFIVDVSGSMRCNISSNTSFDRLDCACAMAMLAANQCEEFKLVATAGNDYTRVCSSAQITNPEKGFRIIEQIKDKYSHLGGGGIFTRQCLEWCKSQFKGEEFDRIIIFSDSQDCDFPDKRVPAPFAKHNYICDVSAHAHGVNYAGVWDAEISGWSEHFLTYIAALEGVENGFESED